MAIRTTQLMKQLMLSCILFTTVGTVTAQVDATNTYPLLQNVSGCLQADQFPSIQGAIAQAGSGGCVIIPLTYPGTDTYTNPSKIAIFDLRLQTISTECQSVKSFGAKGNGKTDDTRSLQAALTHFSQKKTIQTGCIYIPQGTYVISDTLKYVGTNTAGIHIQGDVGGTRGLTGTRILWRGPAGGTVMDYRAISGGLLENFEVDGGGLAAYGIVIEWDSASGRGASGNLLRRISCGGVAGPESACVAIGDIQSHQSDGIVFENCVFHGRDDGSSVYGIKTLGGGNVKDFHIVGGNISEFQYGASFTNGAVTVFGTQLSNNRVADWQGGAFPFTIVGTTSESYGGVFFVATMGRNFGNLTAIGNLWNGVTPPDDVIINNQGGIYLEGNSFGNRRTATSVPIVRSDSVLYRDVTAKSGIWSVNNFYLNAIDHAPLFYGETDIIGMSPANIPTAAIDSHHDRGGDSGSLVRLREVWSGYPATQLP
jgi:Pectate lyase superfamily protein